MKSVWTIAFVMGMIATPTLAAPVALTDGQLNAVAAGVHFTITNLVADEAGVAPTTDPLLLNPWGLSQAPGGPLWVANNHSGTSTLYDKDTFAKLGLVVEIPAPGGGVGAPTGTVFSGLTGSDFIIDQGDKAGHSIFLFATEDGTIVGWNPTVDQTHGMIAVDASARGANYKGLAIAGENEGRRIFAADFANNAVDMFDGGFNSAGSFTDATLPEGYAPFNVQALNGEIYVAFAKQGPGGDELAGPGLGFIDVFDRQGHLLRRLVSNGELNAPWGLTIAPDSFAKFAGALLVGNFGDGRINAYDPESGKFLGTLSSKGEDPLEIDGLWALHRGPEGAVVFSAGTNGEQNGLIGAINRSSRAASWAFQQHIPAATMTSGTH